MTKIEEEMHDARANCVHMTEPGAMCVQCAIKAAQSVQNELLDRYKKRGEEILALESKLAAIEENEVDEDESESRKNGEYTAFPSHQKASRGLTKREHFAAMAMQGLCSCIVPTPDTADGMAKLSVLCADALLRELEDKR